MSFGRRAFVCIAVQLLLMLAAPCLCLHAAPAAAALAASDCPEHARGAPAPAPHAPACPHCDDRGALVAASVDRAAAPAPAPPVAFAIDVRATTDAARRSPPLPLARSRGAPSGRSRLALHGVLRI